MLRRTAAQRLTAGGGDGNSSSTLSGLFADVAVTTVDFLLPGSSPFALLFASGAFLRVCVSLPLTLYGDRCLARSACALPELMQAHVRYHNIHAHPRATSWERQMAAQQLHHERARILRHHGTDNARTTLPYVMGWVGSCYTIAVLAPCMASRIVPTSVIATAAETSAGMWGCTGESVGGGGAADAE